MTSRPTQNWPETNQRQLMEALAAVRVFLESHGNPVASSPAPGKTVDPTAKRQRLQTSLESTPSTLASPALETLCNTFGLSPFERDVLLLCAGVELDSSFGPLCAATQKEPTRPWPTWSLALAALPNAHWSALSPARPLRYWRLIEIGPGPALTTSQLRIDERVLHYLTGISYVDERLAGILEPVWSAEELAPSHRSLANRIAESWSHSGSNAALPVIQLLGDESAAKPAIAAAACATLKLNLYRLPANLLPTSASELESLQRLWEREAALMSSALLLDCDDLETPDPAREAALARLIESTRGVLLITSRQRRRIRQRPMVCCEVQKPTRAEQRAIWNSALGDKAKKLNGSIDQLVSQFSLSAADIRSACTTLNGESPNPVRDLQSAVWDACRAQSRPRLDDLAQHIPPVALWDDLILPAPQINTLREIVMHVRQRSKVYESWGFAGKSARGLGISALFSGASGTGKTMAAEVLAHELRLDLYRIDLSQVVSKYIGETEKNLRRVFDAAEDCGAVLLFDEADALFGKRSEVKDSHDRYANIEVSYLLQRMEAYRGLAILTTNAKTALDPAFQRRIRFIVPFPFPGPEHRVRIWQRAFPASTPTEQLDLNRLARLNVAGGNIRNIALSAAFLAADAKQPVRMEHLFQAARGEYEKLEKPLTTSETVGWE